MPNFTRMAIRSTFLKLLDERPLSDITVKNIVEECGINRNSFYYHYRDIPSLIEEIIKEEADSVIQKYAAVDSIVECFDAMTEFVSHRKRAVMHIYRSVNRETFEQQLMALSHYVVRNYIHTALASHHVSAEDEEAIINYYKCVCFGLIIDWLNRGMHEEDVAPIRRIFRLKQDLPREIAHLLDK